MNGYKVMNNIRGQFFLSSISSSPSLSQFSTLFPISFSFFCPFYVTASLSISLFLYLVSLLTLVSASSLAAAAASISSSLSGLK
jgi:hypothetical protein